MIILRQKSYSSKKNEKDSKENTGKKILGYTGAAVGAGAITTATEMRQRKLMDKLMDSERISENERKELKDKLIKRAEKQGTKVEKMEYFPNSVAVEGGRLGRAVKKMADKSPKVKEAIENAGPIKHIGTDTVVLGGGKLSDPEILAHELGHTQYMHKGRSKDVVAKAAHETQALSKLGTSKVANAAYAVGGFKSGLKSAKNKSEGKKEKTWDKIKSAAIPAAVSAPLLITEAAASKKGLKLLKEAGASKEAMKVAKKNLGTAYKTYLSRAGASVASGTGGRVAGKLVGRRMYKKENEEKKKS